MAKSVQSFKLSQVKKTINEVFILEVSTDKLYSIQIIYQLSTLLIVHFVNQWSILFDCLCVQQSAVLFSLIRQSSLQHLELHLQSKLLL